ncbi:hypothetical protein [Streptomyces mirabilis]|uniref:hypothetical protein n=1 Tax=Streptomyces mirabilis TaxID=68239 RepID=UPI0033CBE90F
MELTSRSEMAGPPAGLRARRRPLRLADGLKSQDAVEHPLLRGRQRIPADPLRHRPGPEVLARHEHLARPHWQGPTGPDAREGEVEAALQSVPRPDPRPSPSTTPGRAKANESLFKPFYTAAREARTQLIQAGGEPYKNYKTRLSIALRLLWPKRPSQRSPFWRPDWRMVEAPASGGGMRVPIAGAGGFPPARPLLHAYGSPGASVAWAPGLPLPTTEWGRPPGPLSVNPRHRGRHSSR